MRSSHRRCSIKKLFLKISQYSQENTCVQVSSESRCGASGRQLYLKEIPTQVFFCEYCEIFKKAYFEENLRTAASEYCKACIHEDCKIGGKCFSTFAGKHLHRSVLFNKYSCTMQLKYIFIQKEVPARVFS